MNIAVLPVLALLLSPVAVAQTPAAIPPDVKKDIQIDIQSPIKTEGAVPVAAEPHHAHVFQNGFVQVYNVTVPPLDATLLYRDDLPYLYLILGATEIVNAVEGKPPVQMTMEDGATRYSPGGIAQVIRTDAGISFHNITVVLAHPQASPHNLGDKGNDRPLGSCPQSNATPTQNDQIPFEQVLPCFETSELRMDEVKVEGGKDYVQASPETAALLIAMSNADLDVSVGGEHAAFLHAGDVLWLPPGLARKVGDFLGTESQFLLISFKDSGTAPGK
ncbi:MAG: hypothetical protein ACYDCG_19965 [Candidatus Acidiferrales bacterium]